MSKGYWLIRVDVADQVQFKIYAAAAAEVLKHYNARFLVRGGQFIAVEGSTRSRNSVVEFPSYQAALDCWHSPEYQAAMQLRLPVANMDLVIIEGYDGPQPG